MPALEKKMVDPLEILWLHALQVYAQSFPRYQNFRLLSLKVSKKWFTNNNITVNKHNNIFDAANDYVNVFNEKFKNVQMEIYKNNLSLRADFLGECPYAEACSKTKEKHMKILCFRSKYLINYIIAATNKEYRSQVIAFDPNNVCSIDLIPMEVGYRVVTSSTLLRGTVKVNKSAMMDIGIDIVDNVKIKSVRTGESFNAVCYTSSRIPEDAIYMNPFDILLLGEFHQGDRMLVEKEGYIS